MIDFSAAEPVARAVLHEGQLLYPYRQSSLKNQRPWRIGCLFPPSSRAVSEQGERSFLMLECLARGEPRTLLTVRVRYLLHRTDNELSERDQLIQAGALETLGATPRTVPFSERAVPEAGEIQGRVAIQVHPLWPNLYRLRIRVENTSELTGPSGPEQQQALLGCQLLLGVEEGEFVSLTDPPGDCAAAARECRNEGTWPVLVGDNISRTLLLAAPIILPDFPAIAPESPGDHCDATEIDELLALRIRTLAPAEKRELAESAFAQELLARCDNLDAEALLALHGALRFAPRTRSATDRLGRSVAAGSRVRLLPSGRADILDLALIGRSALVSSIEEDAEGAIHLCVVIEDDPGRDLGLQGQPGHRFFFRLNEVEVL